MKKLISYLCCMLIVLSSVWMAASVFAKAIMQESLVAVAVDQIQLEEKLNTFFMSLDIPHKELLANNTSAYAKKIATDEEINKEVNRYINSMMDEILYDKKSDATIDINNRIQQEILTYSKDISALSQNTISEQEVNAMLKKALQESDFQSAYDGVVEKLKTQFSATEKLMLKMLRFLQTDMSLYASIASIVLCSVVVFAMNFQYATGLLYLGVSYALSAGSLFLIKVIIPFAFELVFAQASIQDTLVSSSDKIGKIAGIFIILFTLCFIFKVIYNRLLLKE